MKENLNCESLQCIYHIQDISSCRYMLKISHEYNESEEYNISRIEKRAIN